MNARGPIIIIEDDADEAVLLEELIRYHAPLHEVVIVNESKNAIAVLQSCEKPFLVLSGINLRPLNGFELRSLILADAELTRKCTPYIFYAAHNTEEMQKKVYNMQADGYFHSITDYDALGQKLSSIVNYWEQCAV